MTLTDGLLRVRVRYFIDYYRRMNWQMMPEDFLEVCAEAYADEENDFGWKMLMRARTYLRNQHRSE